ncbi:MAG TPA: sigma-54 dependent transcriptional regulator [Burkholderiales bacterium]
MIHSETELLLVDSDGDRQQRLKVLLETMHRGPVHCASPSEWRARLEALQGLRVAFIGPCPDAAAQRALCEALRADWPELPVVLYAAAGIVPALEAAAADLGFVRVLAFPGPADGLPELLAEARRHAQAHPEGGRSRELFRSLVGRSAGIQRVRERIERAAGSDAAVLIIGEAGTGGEVVARNIHYASPRRGRPFVAVSCGAVPAVFLEGELFGYEGAGPLGAPADRPGRVAAAAGGTLFLDEIDALTPAAQRKLLRLIEERVYERVGSDRPVRADVRVIGATRRDLEREVQAGRFRADLYQRFRASGIRLPALRERTEDIPLLVAELNGRLRQERGISVHFAPAAMEALQRYAWPGNVRELAQLVERLARTKGQEPVEVDDLPPEYRAARAPTEYRTPAGVAMPLPALPASGIDLKEYLGNVEYSLIMQALTRTGGVVAHAAQLLGLRRTTLVEKLHKYGVRRDARPVSAAAGRTKRASSAG